VTIRPELRVARVEDLDTSTLRALHLRGLLLDVDETLLASRAERLDASVEAWVVSLRDAGIHLAIVSNGRPERVRTVARTLAIPGSALTGKPFPWAYRSAARHFGVPTATVAMVGDQLFTDVLGARWAGFRTILVDPRSQGGLPHTRLLRHVERRLLRNEPTGGSSTWRR